MCLRTRINVYPPWDRNNRLTRFCNTKSTDTFLTQARTYLLFYERTSVSMSLFPHACLSVSLYVYVSVCLSVYIYVCVSVCLSAYLCIYVGLSNCLSVCLSICMHFCKSASMCVCLYVNFLYICVYIYACIRIDVYIWLYECMCVSIYRYLLVRR